MKAGIIMNYIRQLMPGNSSSCLGKTEIGFFSLYSYMRDAFQFYNDDSFSRDLFYNFAFIQGHICTKGFVLDIEFVTMTLFFETTHTGINILFKTYLIINEILIRVYF